MFSTTCRTILAALLLGSLATASQALGLAAMQPRGEVAQLRQLQLRFDADVAPAGRADAPAPAAVRCTGTAVPEGSGRWIGPRQWQYSFAGDLPPGTRCEVQIAQGLQSLAGEAFQGARVLRVQTGGPFVQQLRPWPDSDIDEEQVFVLRLNGPAAPRSLLAHVHCEADGIGERIPVRLVEGPERDAILRALRLERRAAEAPLSIATLACNRRLPAGARLQLVYGRGVVAPAPAGTPAAEMPQSVERRYAYTVRAPFTASFACERENAQAACMPIRAMRLDFSAPVPRRLAQAVRLEGGGRSIAPTAEDGTPDDLVDGVRFAGPFAENTRYLLRLPAELRDAAGRPLHNAAGFPLAVATGALPPLAKFAAAPFGIVERFAEPDGAVLLPVTLRRVEQGPPAGAPQGAGGAQVRDLVLTSDADIVAWYRRVLRYDEGMVERKTAAAEVAHPLPAPTGEDDKTAVQSRMLSLLQGRPGVRTLALPQAVAGDPRPFEVVGIPVAAGFHVVEIASPLLGAALLDPAHGARRTMFVRTAALVTNLAVHFKLGRENALAWVTTLDAGRPVRGARVRVSDCEGRELAGAVTDAQGIARFTGLSPEPPACAGEGEYRSAYFVSARAAQPATAGGGSATQEDLAFTWSDWQRGIEPWRFRGVATNHQATPDLRAHTITDRSLLRVGERISMKHLLRRERMAGFAAVDDPPQAVFITHVGSGQQQSQPLQWRRTATGGQSAESRFELPPGTRLGEYRIGLGDAEGRQTIDSGSFRVEAFRLPVLRGSIAPAGGTGGAAALVAPKALPVDVQVAYVQGGPAARLPVQVSALLREHLPSFAAHESFSFAPPRPAAPATATTQEDEEDAAATAREQVLASQRALVLDAHGAGRLQLDALPAITAPRELLLEARYADPSGEVQTLRGVHTLWPAGVVAGIRAEDWITAGRTAAVQALALDPQGRPQAGVPLAVRALARTVTSSRKRLVGGFYAYDNQTTVRDLGTLCEGKSDAQGLLRCEAPLQQPGEVELVAVATDAQGRSAQAATSVWVTRQGELWFGGQDHDRMDILPERPAYAAGDTARLQVRMPFRAATALVAVEREGILESRVVQLRGDDPTIALKIGRDWGPNVYVSVLALRGRLVEVPWYSFFTWGYKAPREWWTRFWYEGRSYVAPTALVDLSKPAFRLGVAELRIGLQAHRLDVQVRPDAQTYPVRGQAQVQLRVLLPGGQPAANAELALAAVDEALLELMPNDSWRLLESMLQRRAWGVQTATAQMEIVGRRHYGRKAVPAGGGGGRGGTRELLDTLLLWNPRVQLDAQGRAQVTVPLNDSLSSFRIVAVADAGLGLFGTGQATIRSTQDLQIVSGLPPLVREGDAFRAEFTLRNTTARPLQVRLQARAEAIFAQPPAPLSATLPAGEARALHWDLVAPPLPPGEDARAIAWTIEATSAEGPRDALRLRQQLLPAVPLEVQQASLQQVDGTLRIPAQPPAAALPGRGGLRVALQPTLAGGGLDAVRRWFEAYPYDCLEQLASQALGLRDAARWRALAARMPAYLDEDGLAMYFPPADGAAAQGSDVLTAYLLSASAEAARIDGALALPDALRTRLAQGLAAFVEGRIQRRGWSPQTAAGTDLDVRKLAALEALSRHGLATGRMTNSITVTPGQWPTHAVIDWLAVLRRVADVPQRTQRSAQAQQVLRSRLTGTGTRTLFADEAGDHWWWQMQGADTNAARALLLALDDPAWQDDVAALATGLVGRQQRGVWSTTTANLWASLALAQFSRHHESTPVTGRTQVALGSAGTIADWNDGRSAPPPVLLPWSGTAPQALQATHEGAGKPWLGLQALAALPRTAPVAAGYRITRSVAPVEQAQAGQPAGTHSRGDILRITLEIDASADMTWAVVRDAIPAGATILGSGLGRDSQIATRGEQRTGQAWPAFEERAADSLRAYYAFLPRGRTTLQYTVRLNTVGEFTLPPSRVEAMYAPEMFGEGVMGRVRVVER